MKKKYFLWMIILTMAILSGYMFLWDSGKRIEEEPYNGETTLTKTGTLNEVSEEVVNLIKRYDGRGVDPEAGSMPYYSRRLIVQGTEEPIDLLSYGAKEVIQGIDDIYIMQFTTQERAKQVCEELNNLEEVAYCEPDQYAEATEYKENIEPMSWGVSYIGADAYANRVENVTDASITVAVVDSGVYQHSFLKDRIVEGGWDFIDDDMEPDDKHSHGTHVAGTIVDCTPGLNVKILPVRVLGADNRGSMLAISLGVRHAVERGAEIINMSLSGPKNKTLDNAVIYAVNRGCTVVVAAGNDNNSTENITPAHLEECIVVSAINTQLEKAGFSNWGDSIDFSAPGVDVLSCIPKLFLGITFGDSTGTMSGTSMATPHISALAAMTKLENPAMTSKEIQNVLKGYSIDLGDTDWDSFYGWGMPDFSSEKEIPEIDETESENEYETDIQNEIDTQEPGNSVSAYEGIFMKGDTYISLPLYTSYDETGAIGIVYRVTRPQLGEYGYVKCDIQETIGEIYMGASENPYEIIGEGGSCELIYTQGGLEIRGDSEYAGTYVQISNSGANMEASEMWLDIPE